MTAPVWMDNATRSDLGDRGKEIRQECNLPPLLFTLFLAATLVVAFNDFSVEEEMMEDIVSNARDEFRIA